MVEAFLRTSLHFFCSIVKKREYSWLGHFFVIMTYIIFGINPNCSKSIVPKYVTPEVFTAIRMVFAMLAYWIISIFYKKEKVERRDMLLIVLGAFCLVGTQLAFAEAMSYISPTYVSLISAMSPLIVMLMAAVFLGEPISSRKAIGVLFGISGALVMILFSLHDETHYSTIGAILCFVNILFYASYLLVTRTISSRYSPITLMKWMFLFCAIMSVPLALPSIDESLLLFGKAPAIAYVNMGIVVVFATVVAYFLLPVALKYLRPTTVSMYSNMQPIVTSIVAIAVGQDLLTWNKPLSLILVVIGVFLVTTSRAKGD